MSDERRDDLIDAEFRGSLTICEDGEIRPTINPLTGAVTDRFGIYRPAEDPDHYDEPRREW